MLSHLVIWSRTISGNIKCPNQFKKVGFCCIYPKIFKLQSSLNLVRYYLVDNGSFRFILVTWFLVVFGDEVTKILRNSLFIYHFCLAFFALQTENIIQKITLPMWRKCEKTKLPKWNETNNSVCGIKIIDGHQEEFKMDFCANSRSKTSRISEASSILTGRNKTMAYVSDFFLTLAIYIIVAVGSSRILKEKQN